MVVTDAAYEQRAMNFVECGLYQPAQVMAILAVVEQLKIMNENTKRLYGTALGWKRDVV